MAILDPHATNMALKKTGSDYQMDVPAPVAAAPVAAAPAPATVTVNPVAPVAAPTPAPAASKTGPDISAAGQVTSGAQQVSAASGDDHPGMKKIAALVGTVANAYMGNYAGAAASASQLGG